MAANIQGVYLFNTHNTGEFQRGINGHPTWYREPYPFTGTPSAASRARCGCYLR